MLEKARQTVFKAFMYAYLYSYECKHGIAKSTGSHCMLHDDNLEIEKKKKKRVILKWLEN